MEKLTPTRIVLIIQMLCVAVLVALFIHGCGQSSKYNVDTLPDSLIIQAFDRAGVNPETFAKRVLRAVRAEIAMGKFTRDGVIKWMDSKEKDMAAGLIGYDIAAKMIERYGKEFFLPEGDGVSEVAAIAYAMLMPDIDMLKVPSIIGEQDATVIKDMFEFVRKNL